LAGRLYTENYTFRIEKAVYEGSEIMALIKAEGWLLANLKAEAESEVWFFLYKSFVIQLQSIG